MKAHATTVEIYARQNEAMPFVAEVVGTRLWAAGRTMADARRRVRELLTANGYSAAVPEFFVPGTAAL